MNNIEKSELVIAKILSSLMERGLSAGILEASELALSKDFLPFFATCVRWLESEGIIRANEVLETQDGHVTVLEPTLTLLGFAILGHRLLVDGKEVTAAELVKERSTGTGRFNQFGEFLGSVLGGYQKSLGS